MKRMLISRTLLLALLTTVSSTAMAEERRASAEQGQHPDQTQTETWLQVQARGNAASPKQQSSTPAERDLSLQRWLDTYKHPIPPFYERETGGSFSSEK
ncbi:DUF3613 domain-containing protein [Pseudomonas sp. CDFA 602]|nr:DUF3613 domain-containing protein [Pseudomonas californiensis]MCD5994329.1 DUF3613 domain-containing protein [Pseudomonas californiensis]MCD5999963.1 DUF3613 domain-containing protein [Pseudomonas californiensis]